MNKLSTLLLFASALALAAETVTNPFPARIEPAPFKVRLVPVVDAGLFSPVDLMPAGDGSGRLFVCDQAGQVRVLKNGKLDPKPVLDLSRNMVKPYPGFDERGLLGLAFHPDFAKAGKPGSGRFYTYASEPARGKPDFDVKMDKPDKRSESTHHSVVVEWQLGVNGRANPASKREILRFTQPQWNHDSGCLAFGPDGHLYISTGDGGKGKDSAPGHHEPGGNGQYLGTVLGKVLRIAPLPVKGATKSANGKYYVPAGNPFVGKDGLDEIWAYGFRNPWRISFDGDRLLLADVGQDLIEEVNLVERGGNYGWRSMEGSFRFDPANSKQLGRLGAGELKDMIRPVLEYDHDEGVSITGGHVYRGKAVPALAGKYVMADWKWKGCRPDGFKEGTVDGLLVGDLEKGTVHKLDVTEPGKHPGRFVCGFGRDAEGELYVLTQDVPSPARESGRIYRVAAE